MPKMLSANQPGDPVFKEGGEQIVMANPVWLFEIDTRIEWKFVPYIQISIVFLWKKTTI